MSAESGERTSQRDVPEPDETAKEKAADMMEAYEDKPTLVLPGSGGAVSGTAVSEWLDEDGNPKYGKMEAIPDDDGAADEQTLEDQIAKDKAFNAAVIKATKADN